MPMPRDATDRVDDPFSAVYDELQCLAHRQLRHESGGHTMDTTALVHETYLRLADQRHARWRDPAHFLALAATTMRRILVDHARHHRAAKRRGALRAVSIEDVAEQLAADPRGELVEALDDALERLAGRDARQARVVECRFFDGLTEVETARALAIGLRTAKRDWAKARSWLQHELSAGALS
ncbi:MAG: ECF-type sigma factor [Gemmatirosa sp.]